MNVRTRSIIRFVSSAFASPSAWSEDQVNERLAEIMARSFAEVLRLSEAHGVTMRTAAYMLAIGRVARAQELRGFQG